MPVVIHHAIDHDNANEETFTGLPRHRNDNDGIAPRAGVKRVQLKGNI